jgi:ABC-2 type transport system ATP-binding protein
VGDLDRPWLAGVDAVIHAGVTAVVGSNGAGKSTLLHVLAGTVPERFGTVEVLGANPRRAGWRHRRRVSLVDERVELPASVPVYELVRHLALVQGLRKTDARLRSATLLRRLGLAEQQHRPVGDLSTGQRHRVALAVALAPAPELLLLDEPTSGLDPHQRAELVDLLAALAGEEAASVVFSTHRVDEVHRLADHVIALDGGRVTGSGAVAGFAARAGDLVVELASGADALSAALTGRRIAHDLIGGTIVVPGGSAHATTVQRLIARNRCEVIGIGRSAGGRAR